MRWTDFTTEQPRLADRARERLVDPGVLLVVTIRKDGTPRLTQVGVRPWTAGCGCR